MALKMSQFGGSLSRLPVDLTVARLGAVSPERAVLLDDLLKSAATACYGNDSILRPLWTMEAIHRATKLMRLISMLEKRCPVALATPEALLIEQGRGLALIDILTSVETADERHPLPCGNAIRSVSGHLAAIFGTLQGCVDLRLEVEAFDLPAYKARALILLVIDLLSDVLLLDYPDNSMNGIALEMVRIGGAHARLRIVHRGEGPGLPWAGLTEACCMAQELAVLLETQIGLRNEESEASAELTFPLF